MAQRLTAVFDGNHFRPLGAVEVEPGAEVELIVLPRPAPPHPDAVTRPLTADESRAWRQLRTELQTIEPAPQSFEEYLRESRGEP